MKKIFTFTTLLAVLAVLVASCAKNELNTDQYDSAVVALKAYGPQPVVRGGTLRFVGSNLDKVSKVTIPGVASMDPEVVTAGAHSEIRVIVPKDGPEPGYPVLTLSDGTTITGKTIITYDEPITIEDFTAAAYPGEEITIKGDYLNLIKEVIFAQDVYVSEDDFSKHSRYEISLTVPETAQTGKIKLGTLDETKIPDMKLKEEEEEALLKTLNLVETETPFEVGVSRGQVDGEYKAGAQLTVNGDHLDLTVAVNLVGAEDVEFMVAEDGSSLKFNLPAEATDGDVVLVMASGVEVAAGVITTKVPVVSGVTPAPVKNGAEITIVGSDLDLVTGLDFANSASAEFAYAEGKITTTVTEAAQEGDLVLNLANGKQVTADLDLVEPVVTGFSANPASAGSPVTIEGTDLDLVSTVSFLVGEEEYLPIDKEKVEVTETAITVSVPTSAIKGKVILNLKNGSDVEGLELDVDKPAGAYIAQFPEEEYAPGDMFIIDLENADHLTGVQVDAADVNYILNGVTLYFSIPDTAKKNSQLTLVSDNGSVTYTMNVNPGDLIETVLWEGNLAIDGWTNNEMRDNLIFTGVELTPGQTIRFYGNFAEWWCIQMYDGHWGEMTTGYNDEKHHMVSARVVPEAKEQGFFSLTLTEDLITKLQTFTDWGYWGIIQGEGITLTKITYYEDYRYGTTLWEGETVLDNWGLGNQTLAWGGYDWSSVTAGSTLFIFAESILAPGAWWCIQPRHGEGWAALPDPAPFQFDTPESPMSFVLTRDILDDLVANGGLVVTGYGCKVTKICLK